MRRGATAKGGETEYPPRDTTASRNNYPEDVVLGVLSSIQQDETDIVVKDDAEEDILDRYLVASIFSQTSSNSKIFTLTLYYSPPRYQAALGNRTAHRPNDHRANP
jgi:hypothetical protein